MAKFSPEETSEIIRASFRASDAGDYEEETRLLRMLPLAPHLAMIGKRIYGAEHMKNAGFNLSEANAEFGDDWLDR